MERTADNERALARILSAFEGLSADDVRRALPVLVLSAGIADDDLDGPLGELMLAFLRDAGVTGEMDAAAAQRAVDAYFQAHPLPAHLKAALHEIIDDETARDQGAAATRAAKLLDKSADKRPVGDAPTPAGAHRGGVSARLNQLLKGKP